MRFSLGTDIQDQKEMICDVSSFTKKHSLTLGTTGAGKSYYELLKIEGLLSKNKCGGLIIDPHGTLAEDAVKLLMSSNPANAERIVYMQPGKIGGSHFVGFNPITAVNIASTFDKSSYFMESILHGFGQYNTTQTPRLSRWLLNVILTLTLTDKNIAYSQYLLNPVTHRDKVEATILSLERLGNGMSSYLAREWKYLLQISRNARTQNDLIESVINRMRNFLLNDMMAQMVNVSAAESINFHDIVENKRILIVNLHGLTPEIQKMLGNLMITNMYLYSLTRDRKAVKNPFFVWIDEFGRFASRTTAFAIEETRKFGVYWQIALQGLYQLKENEDADYLLHSVIENTGIKTVFRSNNPTQADDLQRILFAGAFDGKHIKEEIYKDVYVPRQEWKNIRSYSVSKGKNSSETQGESESRSRSQGHTRGRVDSKTQATSNGEMQAHSHGNSHSSSQSSGNGVSYGNVSGFSSAGSFGTTYRDGMLSPSSYNHGTGYSDHHAHSVGQHRSNSETTGSSKSSGQTFARSTMSGIAKGKSMLEGTHQSSGNSYGKQQSNTSGESHSHTYGVTQSLVTFYDKKQELASRSFFSLDEKDRINSDLISTLANQMCFIKGSTGVATKMQVRYLKKPHWTPSMAKRIFSAHSKHEYFIEKTKKQTAVSTVHSTDTEAVLSVEAITNENPYFA